MNEQVYQFDIFGMKNRKEKGPGGEGCFSLVMVVVGGGGWLVEWQPYELLRRLKKIPKIKILPQKKFCDFLI